MGSSVFAWACPTVPTGAESCRPVPTITLVKYLLTVVAEIGVASLLQARSGGLNMAVGLRIGTFACAARLSGLVPLLAASTLLTACAELGAVNSAPPSVTAITTGSTNPQSELEKATEYWGKEYAKSPRDAQIALNYARDLKALGQKDRALAVLQQVSVFHGTNRAINSEYGRLALQFEQIGVAQKLLEQADDPANPDWRIISARGTVLAKQGKYTDAIVFYERALALAPNQASILNNLGLAELMSGHAARAEELLRKASQSEGAEPKVQQNLALVLGLEGKYDEAKVVAAQTMPADSAAQNIAFLRQMVKTEARPVASTATGQSARAQSVPAVRTGGPETSGVATAWLTRTGTDLEANSPPPQH
jgi:Flp pilus assembly protein TadD